MGIEERKGRREGRLITERSERLDIKRETSEGGRESKRGSEGPASERRGVEWILKLCLSE